MSVKVGDNVKIFDIGCLAACKAVRRGYIVCEIDGTEFVVAKRLVQFVER